MPLQVTSNPARPAAAMRVRPGAGRSRNGRDRVLGEVPPKGNGLVYVSDTEPGIRRQRSGKGFIYRLPDGSILTDPAIRARIASLGLPPAYENVWICLDENGHLQATGYDARGRKQYRYHTEWQAQRSGDKFAQLLPFAKALPRIRRMIRRHMEGGADDARTVLAALVALLDEVHLRTGSPAYVQANSTYGATTLLKRHLRLLNGCMELRFTAKGGKRVQRRLRRPKLQRLLEDIADLPGRQLFVWRDDNDILRPVESGLSTATWRRSPAFPYRPRHSGPGRAASPPSPPHGKRWKKASARLSERCARRPPRSSATRRQSVARATSIRIS